MYVDTNSTVFHNVFIFHFTARKPETLNLLIYINVFSCKILALGVLIAIKIYVVLLAERKMYHLQ